MTSTIFWSLSGDLIILQIRLKQKKKGELWHPCFIYLNFDEIISNTFCIYCIMMIIIFLPIFGYLTYWFRINNCCVELIRH